MKGYKGFNNNLQCVPNGIPFQYEVGKTYTHSGTVLLCNSGFHFVENPLDVLSYYGPTDGNRYTEIEADGVLDAKRDRDSKRVASSLKIGAEISLKSLVEFGIKFIFEKVMSSTSTNATTGDYAHSATTGDSAHSATTGDSAHSATTGYYAHSATTGDSAHSATNGYSAYSATTGDSAHSATTGNYAHSATNGYSAHSATTGDYAHSATNGYSAHSATTGYSAHSATTGDSAHSATTGDSAHSSAMGKSAIAVAIGRENQAKAALGNWLVLAEYKENGEVKTVKTTKVDGMEIKADTFYALKGGKFVKVIQP